MLVQKRNRVASRHSFDGRQFASIDESRHGCQFGTRLWGVVHAKRAADNAHIGPRNGRTRGGESLVPPYF